MKHPIDRREFLKLAGLGGVVFASSLGAARAAGTMAAAKGATYDDFYFVQIVGLALGIRRAAQPRRQGDAEKGGCGGQPTPVADRPTLLCSPAI